MRRLAVQTNRAVGFPSAALALVTLQYHALKYGGVSAGVAYAALAGSSAINSILALQTLAGIIRLKARADGDGLMIVHACACA